MSTAGDLHLLLFPFPAQGHLIPLLDLAHHLSVRHHRLTLTVVVTPANLPLLHRFLASTPSASPLVLPLPSSPTLPPGVEHVRQLRAANSSPAALIRALSSLRSAVVAWARSCPHPPTALISDWFLGWTNNLATDLSVPNLVFYCSNAFAVSAIDFLWRTMPSASASHVTLSALPSTPSFPYSRLPAIIRGYVAGDPDWEFTRESFLAIPAAWGAAINTFAALDDRYLAHLRRSFGHDRVWAVGPIQLEAAPSDRGGATSISAEEVTAWLDACPPRSVVYICFGSQYTETAAEIGAIAAALERSGVRFVWVIGSGADLPEGFEAGEMGMLIRGWAPQAAILGHAGVGAFVTHCGWNSVMEAAATGVLLLTWPMTAEQFLNAWLLVEVAGVAVRVGEGGGVPATEDLAKLLVESVSESEAWTEVRARAAELRRKMAEAVAAGGSSYGDREDLLKQLTGEQHT
ncbi:flavonol 3-O-glucosyltransferase UGT89B1-like [Zingiber officinale]|uniref:flavonol 3-O-glucosyltransferase UGT89B1-like n=1 Tax=Zingiber officinale TaxID=94328 RepID=UPI001C4D4049|nr:flavonol 3-O-glucosyltransferase UGT89B1-like [Zingiber officinale]